MAVYLSNSRSDGINMGINSVLVKYPIVEVSVLTLYMSHLNILCQLSSIYRGFNTKLFLVNNYSSMFLFLGKGGGGGRNQQLFSHMFYQ
jgi:hypothetical protein